MEFFLNHPYRYAVEQMLFSLFPGKKPTYPKERTQGADSLVSTLTITPDCARAHLVLTLGENSYQGVFARELEPEMTPLHQNRVLQHVIKQSFYQAGIQALERPPTWGALSGVRPVKVPTKSLCSGKTERMAQEELEEVYHVEPGRSRLAVWCAKESVKLMSELGLEEVSFYVGIPFCPSRCTYCSFVSAEGGRSSKWMEPFLDVLMDEIAYTGEMLKKAGKRIKTLYIGGGTPTTVSSVQLDRLLSQLKKHLPLMPGVEWTLEAGRVDTITREKLEVATNYGVKRLSINPQTMEGHVLEGLGRCHTAEEVEMCYQMARDVGEFDINMDVVAGLPRDGQEGFRRTLTRLVGWRPENITVHTLALKRGSALTQKPQELLAVSEVEGMLDFAWDYLEREGYAPYYLYRQKYMSGGFENIGWARANAVNRYNIIMMEELQSVVSVGGGGITKIVDRDTGSVVRFNNAKYPQDYVRDPEKVMEQKRKLLQMWEKKK